MAFETIMMAILTHPVHALVLGMLFGQAARFGFAKLVAPVVPVVAVPRALEQNINPARAQELSERPVLVGEPLERRSRRRPAFPAAPAPVSCKAARPTCLRGCRGFGGCRGTRA